MIASSSGWAHGFRSRGPKIVYCHTPARWLYLPDTYLGDATNPLVRAFLAAATPFLKRWDRREAATAAVYFANSTVVQQRIRDAYGIEAEILPPPHSVDTSGPQQRPAGLGDVPDSLFHLCVSRLLPYKNVDKIVAAFAGGERRLVVVGAGPEEAHLRRLATSNITFLSELSEAEMRWVYARCEALVAASYEDFGLTPIEAAAFGKPAVALRFGGFLDTIREGETGVFFDEPEPAAIRAAVEAQTGGSWDAARIRAHAETFSEERFIARLRAEIERLTTPA